jgi:putative transposase
MKLIAQIKLLPSPEQANALRKTLEVANTACNYISTQAWDRKTFRQFPIHKLTYYDVKKMWFSGNCRDLSTYGGGSK